VLYGLHKASRSARELGELLIVEGYMDYLTLYQAGIRNAAAVSGTAFTAEHADVIKRFAKRVRLVFDGDRAGQAAAQRAIFVLAPSSLQVSALSLPAGDDPDSFVKREGGEAFLALLKTAKPAEDFLIDKLVSESDGSPHGKSDIINELLPYAHALADAIVRDAFMDKLARRLRVNRRHISDRLGKIRAPLTGGDGPETLGRPIAMGGLEESFLRILITKPELIVYARQRISPEFLTDTLPADMYSIILNEYALKGSLAGLPDICADNPEAGRALSMLAVKPALMENIEDELRQKILLLRQKLFKSHIAKLNEELKYCPDEQKNGLLEELKKYGTYLKEDLDLLS
jgi:DNA primase